MRSLLFAICAAAVFAIWASGARAEPPCESTGTIDAQSGLALRGLWLSRLHSDGWYARGYCVLVRGAVQALDYRRRDLFAGAGPPDGGFADRGLAIGRCSGTVI